MKKILFVSHSSELNGAELALLETLRRLDRSRFEPVLALPRTGPLGEEARSLGIPLVVVSMKWRLTEKAKIWKQPFSWIWNRRGVAVLSRFIRDNGIDLVLTNSAANWSGASAAKKTGIPHVWYIHEILDGKTPFLVFSLGRKRLIRSMRKLSKYIIANSLASAGAFRPSGEVVVIPNGIDIRREAAEDPAALRASLGVGVHDTLMGIVGKIYSGKGQKEAILAFQLLAPRYPDLKLLVIGEVRGKRCFKEIQRIVRRQGLERRIIFTGYRSDLPEIIRHLSVLIVASSVDSFGRAALEAMSAGVPVLAVAKGGLPEMVSHLKTGYLVDSQAPEAIAAGLVLILDDPDRARRIGEEGRTFVEKNFPLNEQVRKIEEVLERCHEV